MEALVKRFTFVGCILIVLCGLAATASAYETLHLTNAPSGATLLSQDQNGLTMQIEVGDVGFIDVNTPDGQFVMMSVDGFARSLNIGEPNLPTLNRLISIPFGAEIETEILASQEEEISLAGLNITKPLIPVQPSLSKSVDPSTVPFEFKQEAYSKPGYYSLPTASSKLVGVMRSVNLGLVVVSPFQYDPQANSLKVYKSLTVRVNYIHPDLTYTRDMNSRYYSPVYQSVYERIFNYKEQQEMLLDDLTVYPIKYLIISNRMFESQLQPFIAWKIKKGFNVVVAYTDVIGNTNTAIKAYIRNLYNEGTPEDPAPSFVLFVGDAQQIPPFQFSGHISDLSFCEYTNDNIPEIYYGRFSAQNTGQLQPQIDKTLEYEQYLMPDPSFLGEVTMIAGVDAGMAPTYGNGQINYGTNTYFNSAHGIYSNTWLYPASDDGGAPAAIIATVNSGIGFINYTAHGSHDGWADPSFSTTNVNALTNIHKYPLAVGNCCLTSTFGTDYSTPCVGEAWLQAANKGAIGYIGASNSSYWDEDYWWGIGYGPVNSNPNYSQNGIGAYDGMFHDHGEELSQYYITNEAVNFCGNLAVTESGSSRTAYYWQIYHLFGDPSLMTYLGVPAANAVSHAATILLTATSFTVNAVPGSYIGISMGGVIHGTAYVDETGIAEVPLTPFDTPGTADIVISAQNKIPYIATIQGIAPTGPYVIYDNSTINDLGGNNNGLADCGEHIILGVQLKNVGPNSANAVTATLSSTDTYVTITDNSESYGVIPPNNGVVNRPSAFAIDIAGNTPDEHNIQFELTVSGTPLDTWYSNFVIPVHAPAISVVTIQINDPTGNNNGILDPGETANVIVTLHNDGSGQATTVVGVLSETDTYVSISDPDGTFGNIVPGGDGNNSANVFTVSANSACPMGHAFNYNLALTGSLGFNTSLVIGSMVGDRAVFFSDDFSTNLGWTGLGGTAEWTIGIATGGQGNDDYGEPDPSADHSPTTDNKVLGNDLTAGTGGDYAASMSSTFYATSPIIDCSNYTGIQMNYFHWLGVERNTYDHATLQAYNGTTWVTLFANGSTTLDETAWTEETYDLSAIADLNPHFQIRFGLGATDGSWNYCGWNIDDISLKGYSLGPIGSSELSFSINNIADSLIQGDTLQQHFKIRNTGDGVLQITFSCDDNWMSFNHNQLEVAPSDSLDYLVSILSRSLNPGQYNCSLNYVSNDSDHPSGGLPVSIFIYAPNVSMVQTQVTDTLTTDQQSSIPIYMVNNGPGRLFYTLTAITETVAGVSRYTDAPASITKFETSSDDSHIAVSDKIESENPNDPPVITDNWLNVSPESGSVNPESRDTIQVLFNSAGLAIGTYHGTVTVASNDPDTPSIQIPITLLVTETSSGCQYVVGDINGNGALNGIDVSYGVGYFKGGSVPPYTCLCNGDTWYVAGDVNGNCVFNGIDITYMVAYFKGGAAPVYCPSCPPIIQAVPGNMQPSLSRDTQSTSDTN
jgi:hypothetical protein